MRRSATKSLRPLEEDQLRAVLLDPATGADSFTDDLYSRVAHLCRVPDDGSDLDVAVLIRHLVRRWSRADNRLEHVITSPSLSSRLRAAKAADLVERTPDHWQAMAWQPTWLADTADKHSGGPDGAALAGTPGEARFSQAGLPADPFFFDITGFTSYRTPGQQAAVRAAMTAAPGSTITAMLPTSSGKTEVALCLAERWKYSVCLIVVPTVALAQDFERRFRDHYASRNERINRDDLVFAWTADTPEDTRQRIRLAVTEGRQRILVTSPESVTRSLSHTLKQAAGRGRLSGLVIDEAHLVTQWGRDFRPEFRTLASLRRELLDEAKSAAVRLPVTLLLSATLGAAELNDLHLLFGSPGPTALIAANALRQEPDVWLAESGSTEDRDAKVLETLAHVPRPAILYVTSPEDADRWATRLRETGYQRLSVVSSKTTNDNRAQVLAALRSTPEQPARTDLVVATSAFGLGIDYAHIRTVVHACLPETVDRWYQELGRGGRDGHACAGFLLTGPKDLRQAAQLATKVLSAEVAQRRWRDLWAHRTELPHGHFLDLEGSSGAAEEGSYNRKWNVQLVQGLVELGAVEHRRVDFDDLLELRGEGEARPDWVAVEPIRSDLGEEEFWKVHWRPWQREQWKRSKASLTIMRRVVTGEVSACAGIADSYQPDERVWQRHGDAARWVAPEAKCGRCPQCRQDRVAPPGDPAPRPLQKWVLGEEDLNLDDLVSAAETYPGLIVLAAADPVAIAPRLAKSLVRRGIRHLAGPVGEFGAGDRLFVDPAPVSPWALTPRGVFVVYPPGVRITASWFNRATRLRARDPARPPVDILLVPSDARIDGKDVVRDLRALDANIALQILGD
ncbi:DEAD/DEAH box helicase [Crossiella sp. SN42]|uniref:protein DpdF n=1 Tax=Crossiella sp. SN42 TaxID=2944808 RepID=UPI00207CAA4A|nr:protein DpdF [Crossiella sp. SN42]MCO1574256.1 DEAD/DEAH box helicase [Crossiella sp. SN42]